MAASRKKAQILIMSSELLCNLLIMLPSWHFQADLSDCRVTPEKKGSLIVLVFKVHGPRAL